MSLARALTRRRKSNHEDAPPPMPRRAQTVKKLDHPIDRSQISLPIELLSTTNVLAYEAPDIHPANPKSPLSGSSSAGSLRSYGDSENGRSSASSMTSPDISREPSPTDLEYAKPSSYFPANFMKLPPTSSLPATPSAATFQENTAPSVPSRALSHTKRNHQALAHNRSMRLSNRSDDAVPPPPLSPAKAPKTPRTPVEPAHFPQHETAEHPFEAELAQVKEVAEEFGVTDVRIWDEEEQWLFDNGFYKFSAEDYMSEIHPLFAKVLDDVPFTPTWL